MDTLGCDEGWLTEKCVLEKSCSGEVRNPGMHGFMLWNADGFGMGLHKVLTKAFTYRLPKKESDAETVKNEIV